jgi:hypothetical protein
MDAAIKFHVHISKLDSELKGSRQTLDHSMASIRDTNVRKSGKYCELQWRLALLLKDLSKQLNSDAQAAKRKAEII